MSENKQLFKKLLDVKKAINYVKKDKAGHNYKYTKPSTLLSLINPELNKNGVFLKSEVISCEKERVTYKAGNKDKEEVLFSLNIKFTFIDVETGETDINNWYGYGMQGFERGYGSALTYAERYFLLKYFNIPTDDDDPDKHQKNIEASKPKELPTLEINTEAFDKAIEYISKGGSITAIEKKYKLTEEVKSKLNETI